MHKRHFLPFCLFNSFALLAVPALVGAAFDAPPPEPYSFALANLAAFPDPWLDHRPEARGGLSAGGARLYGLPEVQPFAFRAAVRGWGGLLRARGRGLNSGPYSETAAALGGEIPLGEGFHVGADAQVLQVAIDDYGSDQVFQMDANARWDLAPDLSLAAAAVNLAGARLGEGGYELPRRLALGARYDPIPVLRLYVEIEQEVHFPLSLRIAAIFQPLDRVALLAGYQSDPGLVSAGLGGRVGPVQATAAYQYHPDLGFSQCYGLAVTF
ncbi:MAG: hypothetical protein C4524_14050 [Candidatus Zixiibacteriota bacterium]|nr:MAG: hypothetical protein C4524_14050 [candidate division Zixibacteria bacterium]